MATSGPIIPFPRSSGDGGDSVRVIPQSLEAEQSTLGAMLLDRDAIARAAERLKPEDFYREGHRQIFSAILHLFDHGDPADIVTVTNELRRRGQLDTTGGAPYLMTLMENCPAAANVEQYAAIVEEKAILRGLLTATDQVQGWVYEGGESVETLIDRAEQAIFQVGQRRLTGDFAELKTLLHDAFEQIERQFKNRGRATGIPTGFDDLDRLTSGLQPSDLIIVAARPSMGKTALCTSIGHHVAVHEKLPVAIFSLEMSKSQLVQRLICSEARVNSQKFRSGYLDENDWNKIAVAVERLYDAPIFIDDTPAISTFEMRAKARRLKAECGALGLIIVDYLQLMRTSGRSESRVQEVSEIARSLKSLARELNVPLIALSQLSRAVEQREDKRPQLSDLRESGCLSGDTLVFLPDEGTYCSMAELEGKSGFRVLAVNPQTWQLEPRKVQKAFATGCKPVYRLTTQSGRTIRATANHKFLTIAGWKRLDELSVSEHVALPRRLPSPQHATMSEDELALLGHLIGDGSTLPHRDREHNLNRDIIPCETWRLLVVPAMKEAGLTTRQMHAGIGVHYCGSTLDRANLSRRRAERVARLVGSEELLKLSQSDVDWDKIAAIEYEGETDVYDLTVEGLHNFVANDIIVHNSIEAEADLVMFIYRETYYRHGRHKDDKGGDAKAEADDRLAEIIIGKQRNGPTGTVKLVFLSEYAKFESLAPM